MAHYGEGGPGDPAAVNWDHLHTLTSLNLKVRIFVLNIAGIASSAGAPIPKCAQMVVSHGFVAASAVTVPLLDTSPGIFTVTEDGSGQGAILNQNGTVNGSQNPASAGSIIQIFATGAGLWNSVVGDGLAIPGVPPFPVPAAPVAVSIGGVPAQITYAGAAPDLVIGVLQINAVVPGGLPPGPQPVLLTVGRNSSAQQRVTVAVQ